MPFGAEPGDDGSVRFALWAPAAKRVELLIDDAGGENPLELRPRADGWFSISTRSAHTGSRYQYRIDGGQPVPDPASRHQPEGVHGPSEVIDPRDWDRRDDGWRGRPWEEAVLYELHPGTFTPEGTFTAARDRLDYLAELGITAVELMPVAAFPGRRGWGYDGVYPFAVEAAYGRPDDLRGLVQAAHERGLMVFLDVVYNHFGPEGNYLSQYAPAFFTDRHHTPWGDAINFDGAGSRWVREFFIHNALYWLEEYRFDGLRLDAVHAILDDSDPDILTELAARVQAGPGRERHIHLVLENDNNSARYLRPGSGPEAPLYRAQWNDDFHHVLHLLLTRETHGYYRDYADDPLSHLQRCLTEGFAYQGEPSPYRGNRPRGEASGGLPATAFVAFLQNHDQIGNRALGERIGQLTDAARLHVATALLLLQPSPPLLFMGQEWASPRPFLFFCDFGPDLAEAVVRGRREEFTDFPGFGDPAARERIPDPLADDTFNHSRLDWEAAQTDSARIWHERHRQLLALRRDEIIPRLDQRAPQRADCTRLGPCALAVGWQLRDARLSLLFNLDSQSLGAIAPPPGHLLYATHPETATAATGISLPAASLLAYLDRPGEPA